MPATVPVPTKSPGDVLTSALFNTYVAANINKLLNQGHRVLTVAQFGALTGLEDGDEVYLEVDGTNGVQWHLRYHLSTTKWRFLGGPPIFSEVTTQESTTSTTYAALATAGPSVALPRAGDYDVKIGFTGYNATSGDDVMMSYDIGGTAAADIDRIWIETSISNVQTPGRERRKTGLTAVTLTAKYKVNAGTAQILNRSMWVKPVTVT